jgi:hypothetical protein
MEEDMVNLAIANQGKSEEGQGWTTWVDQST